MMPYLRLPVLIPALKSMQTYMGFARGFGFGLVGIAITGLISSFVVDTSLYNFRAQHVLVLLFALAMHIATHRSQVRLQEALAAAVVKEEP